MRLKGAAAFLEEFDAFRSAGLAYGVSPASAISMNRLHFYDSLISSISTANGLDEAANLALHLSAYEANTTALTKGVLGTKLYDPSLRQRLSDSS